MGLGRPGGSMAATMQAITLKHVSIFIYVSCLICKTFLYSGYYMQPALTH